MKASKIVYDRNEEAFGIAVFADNGLMEIDIYNEKRAIEGNVYLGKIVKKIKLAEDKYGFKVDIGDGHEAFLSAYEPALKEANMSEGQSVVVQVLQEKHAEKGAKVVRNLHLVGTYLVYCPFKSDIEASRKIGNPEKANYYVNLVGSHAVSGQEGWILRTCSIEASEEQILAEMQTLRDIYENIRKKARTATAPELLFEKENPLLEYVQRYKDSLQEVVVDTPNLAGQVQEIFAGKVVQQKNGFEEYGVDDAIVEALDKTVPLKNGGSLQIEETHACVAIDVDSGNVRGGDIDSLNMEAAKEIARQIRLRNLSGKIVIDFAGSTEYRFMRAIIDCLEEELADDACHSRVLGLSRGGNIEILRQRRRPSLRDLYTVECPTCHGTGRVEP